MVNPKLDGLRQEKLSMSASGGDNKASPIADWVRAVAMIAAKNKATVLESKAQLPEEFSATDFDIVRARALSSQI